MDTNTRINRNNGMNTWRAGCDESRTSGSEGGPQKPTSRKAGTGAAARPYVMGSTASNSAIGTLVERSSRLVLLFPLGTDHTAENTRLHLTKVIRTVPVQMRRSITWDQGIEMANHAQFTIDTDIAVYFCHPYSPWERGTNENTNGLIREYFPKGTDLSQVTQATCDAVAAQLNTRPRKVLGFHTPLESWAQLLATTA
jgi:transposase, IS30 family